MSIVPAVGEDRVRHVRYEELCAAPSAVMSSLFEWLDLPAGEGIEEKVITVSSLVVDYAHKEGEITSQQITDWLSKLNSEDPGLGNRLQKLCPDMQFL